MATHSTGETLADLGYRMPAEWEPHAATWLAWPHSDPTWPNGRLPRAAVAYAHMVKALAEGEDVRILVHDHEMETQARRVLREHKADTPNVHFHHIPTNDSWIRDHGPIFVKNASRDPKLIATSWGFNSWGEKYPPFDLDNAVSQRAAEAVGVLAVETDMILEGGSIEVNGEGVLLTTEACLLNPNRNPRMTKEQIEQKLRAFLGVTKILWLGDGIDGDDTDGHVDDLTRFVDARTLLTAVEPDRSDVNHAPLAENRERLNHLTDQDGRPFEIIELPMPEPLESEGNRLPASYANFLIANAAVLLPVFGGKRDDVAAGILADLFPGRKIARIDARDLVYGLGACHCLSQQQPAI
jgi:agmatine deiminase